MTFYYEILDSKISEITQTLGFHEMSEYQSRINKGSDGTLARAPLWIGLKRGPQFIFWGPYLSKYYKTELKVQKTWG
jgi:hypothetical protein